jgi:hypothetical protein
VDTCTVTALDAITAFAVPNPNCSSQSQSVFSGLALRQVTSPEEITQSNSEWPKFNLSQPFRPSTVATLNANVVTVNAAYWCNRTFLGMNSVSEEDAYARAA